MRRTARALQAGLLALALAALAVPAAINAAPAFIAPPSPPAPVIPAAQLPPASLAPMGVAASPKADAAQPDPARLAALLNPILASDAGSLTGQVLDAATGAVLYDRRATAAAVPASNLKLFTAVSALKNLGADTRLQTSVLRGSEPGTLVLRAGGDVLLGAGDSAPGAVNGHAGLTSLAQQTVAALGGSASGGVRLLLDDSVFTGAALNPEWDTGDVTAGEIAPVFPLATNSAMPDLKGGSRPQDSALAAAQLFASILGKLGVPVQGAVGRVAAGDPAAAEQLAAVASATVAEQVAYMLQNSDNFLAEVLARLAATGQQRPGSSADATAVTLATVKSLGVDVTGLTLADSSGLAMANQVSAAQFAQLVKLIVTGDDANIRRAIDGFPVAGLSGTLESRYDTAETAAGSGLVRAKTGTLNVVKTLSGFVLDADGRLLVFSFMGNNFSGGSAVAQPLLDQAAATLAGCGCR
ncbi:MAG: D-alanyl-D-alanine carboxypeptidase/D-alanyl-D-alanine-endopeptidase [Renibacterium salmoninarum]|nr:D-alanyl-D-alanine carboxypeptidase/D-alanyl-D-alanine-endopeptidase [Renibacterium salmoninarum]